MGDGELGDLAAGWQLDHTGRHRERWYSAGEPTSRVRDAPDAPEGRDQLADADRPAARLRLREGWWSDPTGRHQQRWYSAGVPTSLVDDGGTTGDDPLPVEEAAEATFAPAARGAELPAAVPHPLERAATRPRFPQDPTGTVLSGWTWGYDRGGPAQLAPQRSSLVLALGVVLVAFGVVAASWAIAAAGAVLLVGGAWAARRGRGRRIR